MRALIKRNDEVNPKRSQMEVISMGRIKKQKRAIKSRYQQRVVQVVEPQWLEESKSQVTCGPENFKLRREQMLHLSVEQCAKWLRVHRTSIVRWENGTARIPFAAFEALRLLSKQPEFCRRHDHWLGWKFTKAGELVSPDGTLIFTPQRLFAVAQSFGLAACAEMENTKLKASLAEADAEIERLNIENIHLRQMAAADSMVDELHSIKEHVESLLCLVDRAKVYKFPESRVAA